MKDAAMFFIGGYSVNERQIKRTERLFDELTGNHYCSKDPKAVAFSKDGVFLGQQNINNAIDCPYIDPIIVQGPAFLYDGVFQLQGWDYMVNYNYNFTKNIWNVEKVLESIIGKEKVALLIPLDKVPSASQHEFDEKVGLTIEKILSGNYDFSIQMSDKVALAGLEEAYDQHGFMVRNEEANNELIEIIVGHCMGTQTGRLPKNLFKLFGTMYGARGLNDFNKIFYWLYNSWNHVNKWEFAKNVLPALNSFRSRDLSIQEAARLLEKVTLSAAQYRGEGEHFVLEINHDPDFARDIDTYEEAEALGYEYLDVAKHMGISWEEFRRISKIKESAIITPGSEDLPPHSEPQIVKFNSANSLRHHRSVRKI